VSAEVFKRAAAWRAADLLEPGLRLGLGTGSTARHFVDILGERVRDGLAVVAVPTSDETREQALRLGIPLTTLDETPELDLTIDGADEIDPRLRLIKGGGGAHLREKMVASASRRMIVIADDAKRVPMLGRFPLPIEVVCFGLGATRAAIARAFQACGVAGDLILRQTPRQQPFVTDSGHWIVDAHLERLARPDRVAAALDKISGVVEHGLFIGLAQGAILAGPGGVSVIGRLD
jgi:ribose 5-phosphate isomerase A